MTLIKINGSINITGRDGTFMYDVNTYTQSTTDDKKYEGKPLGDKFPYDLTQLIGKNYGAFAFNTFW
jgi:hypothetical protein